MSVFKTAKSPFYWYSFDLQRQRFSGTTKCTKRKDAERFELAEKERAKAAIKAQSTVKHSLQIVHVAARYWEHIGKHHAGAATTERDLNRLVDYFGDTRLITDITDIDVSALVAWRRGQPRKGMTDISRTVSGEITGKGSVKIDRTSGEITGRLVAPATVNRSTTEVLKKLFTFAKGEGVRFDHEPKWKNHFLKEPEERVRELHDHEASAIDAAMRDDYAPIFEFVRVSGWRRGAAISLKWSEVNWSTKTITKLGKGGRRITLTITPSIHAILWPLQGHHPEAVFTYVAARTIKSVVNDTFANGTPASHSNTTPASHSNPAPARDIIKGQRYPITAEGLKTRWRRTRDDAGLKDFRFHDFRHDTATKLLRDTGNLKLVQKALGHANLKTTAKYAHVMQDEVASALEALAQRRAATSGETAQGAQPAKAAG